MSIFEPDSETITPSQVVYSLSGTLPYVLTSLSFFQGINLSFDVFNTFIVII